MKSIKQLLLTVLTLAMLLAGVWAQTTDSATPAPKKTHKPAAAQPAITAADVQALKDALAAQKDALAAQQQQLQQAQQNWQQAQTTAAAAASKATAVQAQASQQQQTLGELKSDVADLKTVSSSADLKAVSTAEPGNVVLKNAVLTLQDPAQASSEPEVFNKQMESPITLRFKGINITPGGYAAA